MEVFRVLSSVSLGEGVDLDPEGDALLSAVLPGRELCADAVHLEMFGRGGRSFTDGGLGRAEKCKASARVVKCDCFHAASGAARSTEKSLCGIPTCTKTDVLFFMSHRNSAALSWEG